jgi:hypothetical protein
MHSQQSITRGDKIKDDVGELVARMGERGTA